MNEERKNRGNGQESKGSGGKKLNQGSHSYVELARETVEEYACKGRVKNVPVPLPPEFAEEAGVFVSIKKNGQLRGCIGTIEPVQENLAEEIIRNAISAAFRDPRFLPVEAGELADLEFSVDVLGPPEEISDLEELDPVEYGVIVERGPERGLLLPNLEGVDTVEEQVRIARMKAGIPGGADFQIYRFRVKRYR